MFPLVSVWNKIQIKASRIETKASPQGAQSLAEEEASK